MPSAASTAEQHFLQFAIQWASIVLLYYDYALTFPNELQYIWKSGLLKVSTGLYILYRYALLANVLYLLAISQKLGNQGDIGRYLTRHVSCDTVYKVIGVVSVLGRAAVIFTFLMRTYAVWAKNKLILVVLGAIGLTCVILDCLHVPGVRCHGSSTNQLENTLLSILVCVFEASATLLTFARSVQVLRFGGGPLALKKHTLDYLIVEQGALYFGLISCFTVGATVLNFKASGGFPQRLLNAFTLPLSGMITARLLLRIRAFSHNTDPLGRQSRTRTTQEMSSFAVGSRLFARPEGYSLADEFGEDPLAMLSATTASASAAGDDAVVADFLDRMRGGLQRGDSESENGMSSMGAQSECDEKKPEVQMVMPETVPDLEVVDVRERNSGEEVVNEIPRGRGGSGVFAASGSSKSVGEVEASQMC